MMCLEYASHGPGFEAFFRPDESLAVPVVKQVRSCYLILKKRTL